MTWDEYCFSQRRHNYALVIPVINEGQRIRRQLERIAELSPDIDIVIADGGSGDGALDHDFLRRLRVRALLVKTGEGKLSAQLRMAYRWALDQGYAGVVTIDGNNKDGVEAIPLFMEKLRQGYDYVQGSRYVAGGVAINTPLDRKLAGRFLHAPLLSFGAGRWLTDTTNGFRAYSRGYLEDERTAAFRDVFKIYNLLFYLTVRASALGYSVTQVPVERAYPAEEKTPTKIAGLGSRVQLLSEAFNAATGAYSPPGGPPQHRFAQSRMSHLVVAGLVFLLFAAFTLAFRNRFAPSPDSWTLFELGKSIPTDFYHLHIRRSFWSDSLYSAAFPPLWPTLLMVFDRLTGLGATSGYYLSILAWLGFCAASEMAGRRIFDTRWIGLGAGVLLLSHDGALDEILGGRTIPIQLLLYAVILGQMGQARIGWVGAAMIGVCAGLALLNRFDALLFVVMLAIVLPLVSRRAVTMLPYAIAVGATILPWIVYSCTHFGRWFATDNGPTALSVDPRAFVTDWWPQPQLTLFDAPGAWFAKVAVNGLQLVPAMLTGVGRLWLWLPLFLAAGAFVLLAGQARVNTAEDSSILQWVRTRTPLVGFAVALAAILPSYVLTGYFDGRYFAPYYWLAALATFGLLASTLANKEQRDLLGLICFVGAMIVTTVAFASLLSRVAPSSRTDFPRDRGDTALERCLFSKTGSPVLLSTDAIEASRLSAVYGWNTIILPQNFDRLMPEEARRFVIKYRVTHLYAVNQNTLTRIQSKLPLASLPNCPAQLRGVG